MRKIVLVLLGLLAAGIAAAGGVSGGAGKTVIVEVQKFKFIPPEITVKVGTTVRWVNKEKRQYHSVWFRQLKEPEAEYFWPDETYEKTFDKPGDYPYVCEPHEESHNMKGVVHVVD